jgi:hypothetical protein
MDGIAFVADVRIPTRRRSQRGSRDFYHGLLVQACPDQTTHRTSDRYRYPSLKLRGLAGMAYWILIAIVLIGIEGGPHYSQIPHRVSVAELSLREPQEAAETLPIELASAASRTTESG